jgi:DNA-binding MarR family transcriptional regulator/GNAT superfamily N-acetyltransferase
MVDLDTRIDAVRRFNRFYTQRIGVLREGYLGSPFSLAEARVIYELGHRITTTAAELGRELGLDAGYVSRILRGFSKRQLIDRNPSESDRRQSLLSLTERGREAFAKLDAGARDELGAVLGGLSASELGRVVEAMGTIMNVLGKTPAPRPGYVLRPPRPGDMGWVVHRHGVLYAQEYGWDERFEALVAEIVAEFVQRHDPERERCWMAEVEGEVVGSVFLTKQSARKARLRLLLVEPKARGLGLGAGLVGECVRFARSVGYREITLWTNHVLDAARHIYRGAGFRLVAEEPHRRFGPELVGETWELKL